MHKDARQASRVLEVIVQLNWGVLGSKLYACTNLEGDIMLQL